MLKNENEDPEVENNFFDIETTGLAATDMITCFSYGGIQCTQTGDISEKDLLLKLSEFVHLCLNRPVVTFFGELKYGSSQAFDMPMVRTRYLMNGIGDAYPFKGMSHIDLSEIIKKYFNTSTLQEPAPGLLSASQVVDLMNHCGMFPLKTKEANLRYLEKEMVNPSIRSTADEFVKKNVKLKVVEHNSMDNAFGLFFPNADERLLNEEFAGPDMPGLFESYLETHNDDYLDKIMVHNKCCIEKTAMLFKALVSSGMVNPLSIPKSLL